MLLTVFSPVLPSFLDGHVFFLLLHLFILCKADTHYILTLHRASQTQLSSIPHRLLSPSPVIESLFHCSYPIPSSVETSSHSFPFPTVFLLHRSRFPTSPIDRKYVSHSCERIPQVDTVDGLTVITCHLWYPVPCSLLAPIVKLQIFTGGTSHAPHASVHGRRSRSSPISPRTPIGHPRSHNWNE